MKRLFIAIAAASMIAGCSPQGDQEPSDSSGSSGVGSSDSSGTGQSSQTNQQSGSATNGKSQGKSGYDN